MADDMIRFRPDEALSGWLATSSGLAMTSQSASMQAREDLALLRMILDAELRRVRLTLAQANCVADVLNGTIVHAAIGAGLGLAYAECYDAFRLTREDAAGNPLPVPGLSSYGAKWAPEGTDPAKWEQDLLGILGQLGPAADYALRRAIALWWMSDELPRETPEQEAAVFAAVGLRVTAG